MKYETSIECYEVAEGKVSINGIKWLPRWDVKVTFEKQYEAKAFQKKLEQPEDVAVAYIRVSKTGHVMACAKTGDFHALPDKTLLYTRPQPAAWVGLTDDDIWKSDEIMAANSGYGANYDTLRDLTRAIEAKLREKNGSAA